MNLAGSPVCQVPGLALVASGRPLCKGFFSTLYVVAHHPGTLVASGLGHSRRADRPFATGPF